jgi:hypothetical protein
MILVVLDASLLEKPLAGGHFSADIKPHTNLQKLTNQSTPFYLIKPTRFGSGNQKPLISLV